MIASRGLRPANYMRQSLASSLRAPRHLSTTSSLKNVSALSRSQTQLRTPSLGAQSLLTSSRLRIPFLLSTASAIRYASTAPSTPAAASGNAAAASGASADAAGTEPVLQAANDATSNLDGIADDFLANIASMPESIGYLKAIGLDYGWGPTSCIEWILEHVHIYTGTPWWASIMITAVLVRAALFKFFVMTSDITARQGAMKEVVAPINERMQKERVAGNSEGMMVARAELMQVYKAAGINPWKAFLAPVAQAITGYCSWKLLRAMAALPVPGLETGGLLWLKDLTVPDPFFILPIAFGGLIHFVSKRGGETGAMSQMSSLQRKFLLYFMPSLATVFTLGMPGAVQISFVTASMLGMVQARLLQTPAVRQLLGIAPIVTGPGAAAPGTIDTTATSKRGFNYQPPNKSSGAGADADNAQAAAKEGMFAGVRRGWDQTMKEAKQGLDDAKARAGLVEDNKKLKGHSKEFLKRAEEYEERRAREDRERRRIR